MLSRIKDSGADIKRFCGDPQRFRQLLQHFGRRFAQAPLDLTQIGIGNPGLLGQLTQRQLRRLTLPGNELTEGAKLVRDLVGSNSCHAIQFACNCKQMQNSSLQACSLLAS